MAARNVKDIQVVIDVHGRRIAFPAEHVREMVGLPKCTAVPDSQPHVRGVIDLRGKIYPVIDLRVLLGMEAARAESEGLVEMLRHREEEHRAWLAELEASIREKRDFHLAIDPSRCAFGIWYQSYRAENTTVSFLLGKMEGPHREIHSLADRARHLLQDGRMADALAMLEEARGTTLSLMLQLFAELYDAILDSSREIGVVLSVGGRSAVFAVDSVLAVEPLRESSSESFSAAMSGLLEKRHFRGFGKMRTNEALVLLADPESLLSQAPTLPTQ